MDIAWGVLLPAATVFTLGAISPGPSLLVVLRNTLIGGRRRGIACALGHGIGFGMYALCAVFGLIYLLEEHPSIFQILQILGAVLLLYYGYSLWNADSFENGDDALESTHKGWIEGFAIAFFNPKIALFLVAVLAQVLEPNMNLESKIAVGFIGMAIDTSWYLIVALLLTGSNFLELIQRNSREIYRTTAVVLWLFAVSVVWTL